MNRKISLSDMSPGQSARVEKLCTTGRMRRRLMDLGLVQGTQVSCVGKSPAGDPLAYLIKGAVIAIRRKDGEKVWLAEVHAPGERVVALAGNPNVGKSTLFNGLTGMKQHTGNWPGKTVACAEGRCRTDGHTYRLVDIPGTYSLAAHSPEEEAARDFLCFGHPDAVVVVCDAACLERNLTLVLQILEITPRVLVCVNLMDEAGRRHMELDLPLLEKRLGVPVVGTTARKKKSREVLLEALDMLMEKEPAKKSADPQAEGESLRIPCHPEIDAAALFVEKALLQEGTGGLDARWLSLRLLEYGESFLQKLPGDTGTSLRQSEEVKQAVRDGEAALTYAGIDRERCGDLLAAAVVQKAEMLCQGVVKQRREGSGGMDSRLDRILTGRITGYPVMALLLLIIFWITITGANVPSGLLGEGLFWLQAQAEELFNRLCVPQWITGLLLDGGFHVTAWVVSVMLPPMAIFFPLFTLLEDSGYLPRIAYNLDRPFQRCRACGKQGLCMCMGFGCNAAGVVGCRIIDSPRERLLAILTNSFVPCNGRFPVLIGVLTMFFVGRGGTAGTKLLSAFFLTCVILVGVVATFLVTRLLSATVLKGVPSAFTLELPPYRRPQVGKVIVRSVFDRTLFVLGRAVAAAVPAGLLIWLLANLRLGDQSLLVWCATALEPAGRLIGLDGVILLAFLLAFPANEIVLPLMLMAYTAGSTLLPAENLWEMKQLFAANGWSWLTAVNVMLFSLMHWPCATTLLTIKKETRSLKWTALAAALPTACGILLCAAVNLAGHLLKGIF